MPIAVPGIFGGNRPNDVVAFDGRLLAVGGVSGGCCDGSFSTDTRALVWSSTDGATWSQRAVPGFPARTLHASAAFNGRLYVVGGASDELYETGQRYNDVWSTDGTSWRQEPTAPFTPRSLHSLVVRNNELWMLGGLGVGYLNEVWRTADGAAWRLGFTHEITTP